MKVFQMKSEKAGMQVLHLAIYLKQEMLQILLVLKALWIVIDSIIQWVMIEVQLFIQGYINENYGGVVNKENVASAVNAVENMAARRDITLCGNGL